MKHCKNSFYVYSISIDHLRAVSPAMEEILQLVASRLSETPPTGLVPCAQDAFKYFSKSAF